MLLTKFAFVSDFFLLFRVMYSFPLVVGLEGVVGPKYTYKYLISYFFYKLEVVESLVFNVCSNQTLIIIELISYNLFICLLFIHLFNCQQQCVHSEQVNRQSITNMLHITMLNVRFSIRFFSSTFYMCICLCYVLFCMLRGEKK